MIVDPVTKKRRLQTKQAEQLGSPSRTGPSQYVTQVPSPDKDEELKPRFANDSRCLLNLSKKLEKEFKRFDKLKNQNPGVPEDVNTSKANDSTRKVKNHFCSQLVRFSKETLCDRNTWLHSLNSRSKNKREEKPRKRLPIRLLNMQPAQFGFVTCNFEIDYSRTDDVEYIDLRRPRIVFPANLANEMGLTDQMVVEIFEPWQVITCEQTQCNYFLNPFWVRVVHRNQPDEINPPSPIDYLNESGANDSLKVQTAKDCISSHRPTYGLRPSDSFETIYAHPDWVV